MQVEENRLYRMHLVSDPVAAADYNNSRNVLINHTFVRGRYVIIPSTEETGLQGKFVIRLYTSKKPNARLA